MVVPRAAQVRGMLLEEALLFLLRRSGYKTISNCGNDPTLMKHGAGIAVKGRGGNHQIDAIADFILQQPFSNPQRLLVEAKFLDGPVGIPVARNAVGVLKDVQEYWHRGPTTDIPKSRYHYAYAIFSARGYKKTIQEYAFAQDIYLISLANSAYIQTIIDAIQGIAQDDTTVENWWPEETSLGDMRRSIRRQLTRAEGISMVDRNNIQAFLDSCRQLNFCLLGLINGRFPIFLVPAEGVTLQSLESHITMRPRWDDSSWYLFRSEENGDERKIFSFDLPEELFSMYAKEEVLTAQAALNLKQAEMGEIHCVALINDEIRVIRFLIDNRWIEDLLNRLNNRSQERERSD